MVDLVSLMLLMSFFGRDIAIAYAAVGLILAVVGGTLIEKFRLEKYAEVYVRETDDVDAEVPEWLAGKISYSKEQVRDIIKGVWLYVLIGVGTGEAIHNWIPQTVIEKGDWRKQSFCSVACYYSEYSNVCWYIRYSANSRSIFCKRNGLGDNNVVYDGGNSPVLVFFIYAQQSSKTRLLAIFVSIVVEDIKKYL